MSTINVAGYNGIINNLYRRDQYNANRWVFVIM